MLPLEKKWIIASGMKGNLPAILRMREDVGQEVQENFPGFMLIKWEYDGGASGMPDPQTQLVMGDFEDQIIEGLESRDLCQHVITYTHNNKVEFFVYVSKPEQFAEELNKALEDLPLLPIQINYYDDAEWEAYNYWLKIAANTSGQTIN